MFCQVSAAAATPAHAAAVLLRPVKRCGLPITCNTTQASMLDDLPSHPECPVDASCDGHIPRQKAAPGKVLLHSAEASDCEHPICKKILFGELALLMKALDWYKCHFDVITLGEPDCEAALEQRILEMTRECAALCCALEPFQV